MQKETNKKFLYTILFEFYERKESFIDQLLVNENQPKSILNIWARKIAIDNRFFKKEEQKLLLKLVNDKIYKPVLLNSYRDIWFTSFTLNNSFFLVHIVRTSTYNDDSHISNNITRMELSFKYIHSKKEVEIKYNHYKEQYLSLKNTFYKNREINKKRRTAEKKMQYWYLKAELLRKTYVSNLAKGNKNLYTIIFEYAGGTFISQLSISSNNIDLIFANWCKKILSEYIDSSKEKIINNQEDRLFIMEKVVNPVYQPQPLSNFINVWTTYFNLSKGLGDITIIKTSQE